MSLILDKITPPAERPRLSRARLLADLTESLGCCNSTVIHGRTGAGKTLLAADFAGRANRRVAWYKVDSAELELQLFVQYLVAAVRVQHPGFGRKTLTLAGAGAGTEEEAALLAESFVYEMTMLEGSEPLLVVVDDLHLVYDAAWVVPFFGRMLPLLPAETHVILIGRTLPPAPLWRMRSKQTLCVVDESALNFTLDEAEQLFAGYGLPAKLAAQALAESWGRAAALDALARGGQTRAEERASRTIGVVVESLAPGAAQRQQRNPQLRLVKGYMPKTPAGAN
jgi:LuxR family transcriptional regulator, maltose regulon positive regulatory protein